MTISFEEALAVQKNLDHLCADRDLNTYEIFAPNAFYGIDKVLKEYTGLPYSYSLKVVIPHGPYLNDDFIWDAEKNSPLATAFCYPPYREHVYIAKAQKKPILSAAPFLYVVEMLKEQPKPPRQGTIFFPTHSSHHVTVEMDFKRLAEALTHLSDEYQPVTVCMYWRDYNLGHHKPFQARGLPIVSAGHMFDTNFLFRFFHLCSMHRYAAGNEIGTHMFYSIEAGCSYFLSSKMEVSYTGEKDFLQYDANISPNREIELKLLFSDPKKLMGYETMKVIDYYMGKDYFLSRNAMLKQLIFAELIDKFGFFINRNKIPYFFWRLLRNFFWRLLRKSSVIKSWIQRIA